MKHPSKPHAPAVAPLVLNTPQHRTEAQLVKLFCRALDEVNRLERRPVLSAIAYVMGELEPLLDLPAMGLSDLTPLALVAEQQGVIKLTSHDHEILVRRVSHAPEALATAITPQTYRAFLETKMKSPIPPQAVRQQMFDLVADILFSRPPASEPITLLQISYDVADRMRAAINQQAAFKLLFALVLAGAFRIVRHEQPHQIRLLSAMLMPNQWDVLFLRSCVNAICRDRPKWPLLPNMLAEVFDVPEDTLGWLTLHRRTVVS